jgi:serine protease Do
VRIILDTADVTGVRWALPALAAALLAAAPAAAQQRADAIGASRHSAIAAAAARVAPAVVSVNVVRRERQTPRDPFEALMIPRGFERRVEGLGTGFIVAGDGLIITNQHVTAGADQIVVTLRDGRDLPARLLGEDDHTDIAVLKVDASGLPVAPLGRSRSLAPGDWAIAIGNPYGYLLGNSEPSVTAGVVSALGRDILPSQDQAGLYVDMIQTDAAINPGNSGGPLVDADGQVVGVNTFILSQTGGSVGLGFAIPIERAMRVARDLQRSGRVRRGWVGVEIAEPAPQSADWRRQPGVVVRRVAPGGPAAAVGLKPGDLIERAGGQVLRNFLSWERVLVDLEPGDTLSIAVRGGGGLREVALAAVDLPSASAERISLQDLQLISVTPDIQAERGLAVSRGALVVGAGPSWQRTLGLQPGDVILQINNYTIAQAEQVQQVVGYLRGRAAMRFYFARGDQLIYADLWGSP